MTCCFGDLGEVAETFDNRDELPLIIDPIRPLASKIDGAVEACEKVAYHFGGWYCAYFADTFLPALRERKPLRIRGRDSASSSV